MSNVIDSREAFFAQKPKTFTIELPDMGSTVHVLKGNLATLKSIRAMSVDGQVSEDKLPNQLAMILADADGQLMCTTPEDIEKLSTLVTLSDMRLIMEKWQEVNGLTADAIDELAKNSEASLKNGSESGSLVS